MIRRLQIQEGKGLCCVMVLCAGCASGREGLHRPVSQHAAGDEIHRMLAQQAQAWNTGDIKGFMAPYWHSSDLTFSSAGRVTRGWQATLDRYHERYPTPEAMGHLTFDEIEVTHPGSNVALVLGRWRLDRAEPIGGVFTLVLRKEEGQWIIIHDHTSAEMP